MEYEQAYDTLMILMNSWKKRKLSPKKTIAVLTNMICQLAIYNRFNLQKLQEIIGETYSYWEKTAKEVEKIVTNHS